MVDVDNAIAVKESGFPDFIGTLSQRLALREAQARLDQSTEQMNHDEVAFLDMGSVAARRNQQGVTVIFERTAVTSC